MEKNLPPDRARDNQHNHFTRAHSANDLPPDSSSCDRNYDDRRWANEQEKVAHLLKYLDNDLITADLHTHLMGMGDHSFWIDQIMRNYLFTQKERTLESLEWYGPLCYHQLPNLEIVLKNTEEGSYSILSDEYPVEMKPRNDGYHFTLHPTSDPFTFDVVRKHENQQITKRFKLSNWGLLIHVSCEWNAEANNGIVSVDAKSKAKQDWFNIGLPPDAWQVYTILNWQSLRRVPFDDQLVVNILRLHRESSWMNLPLSTLLCKKLMTMEETFNNSTWDWKAALNFTTDVVFDIESFQDSMHIEKKLGTPNVLHEIIARLALNRKGDSDRYLKEYMFFNVKTQQFDYQWGITNTDLCYLMEARSGTELEAKATLAQIRNCFTMLNVDGSTPSNSDLVHRFRRHFTPEFYPMRFKLRDPIYEQHPYTLTLLLKSVLKSYSLSRTSYVEFSLGLNTLITPWIYKYLVHESIWKAIPSPEVNAERPMMKYRFLIGFSRNSVKLPIDGELRTATDSEEAWNFLVKSPNIAMAHSFNSEAYSAYEPFFKQLNTILSCLKTTKAPQDECGLLNAVVGLDFVSDELGYPYCPFIQDKWLNLASEFKLGIRLHCGEGVVREKKGPIKRAMYAHMYIMALAIRRICARGIKCRIGHGVAFQDCIVEELTEKKKSYEQIQSSRLYCIPDGTQSLTPFLALISDLLVEVNITSNSYLVQHANSSFLIKLLNNWLLCTDDDGVWAPPPCAHDHRLQALEYCRAISMGNIDKDDLEKAEHWREFCFNHSEPKQRDALELEHTWTCKFHPLRAYAMISLALCIQDVCYDSVLPLGLIELLHSFGFYDGFANFAKTIAPFAELLMDTNCWRPKDRKIQYFLKVLNPDGSIYGLLRSLFLGYDECLQLIWFERDVKALCKLHLTVPPLLPKYPNDPQRRLAEAKNLIRLSKAAAKQIVNWITCIRNQAETKSNLELTQWINSRLLLLDERGCSEMKYGVKYVKKDKKRKHSESGSNDRDDEDDKHDGKRRKTDDDTVKYSKEHSLNDVAIFEKWLEKSKNNGVWKTVVEKSEKIKELEGLILCDSKYLQPNITVKQDEHNFFHIICNTQDQSWYIRPLPPSYVGEYMHVDAPDLEGFHTTITTDDRVPVVWYRAALSIATRLFQLLMGASINKKADKPQIIRIAGVGYSGSAIAVLAGLMIATEFHHQETVKKTSISNEVIVWTYGGKQFGSKSFHNKVHNLCAYNLEITQWRSLQDVEARTGEIDSLFSPPYCYLKDILVYPIGPPMIIPWDLRPSWHYFTLMLHHLPPCMEFRNAVTKPNEMNIFFADDKKDLKSLAQSLYFPEYTLICTHESDSDPTKHQHDENTDYGPLMAEEKNLNVKVIPTDKIRISPYVWKWHPQQRKSWIDIFNFTPVQTTMRLLGDLLLAILNLDDDIIISLSPNHCDIITFDTMSPKDVQNLNGEIERYVRKSKQRLPYFMNLMNRRDTFNEEYCLLLLDLTYLRRSCDNNSRTSNIRRQLEKAFSTTIKPFRHPESDLITNVEILLITLQNSNACNPFLHFILGRLNNMIDNLPLVPPNEHLDINKFKSDVTQLLHHGSPDKYDKWQLATEMDNALDCYTKYKKKFDKADVGSYKSYDLALSLYFLSGEDKTQVYEVMLRQVWNVTDWLTRRMEQNIAEVEELWKYKIGQVHERLEFLKNEKEKMSEECKYIYDVEQKKFKILKKENDVDWKSLGETLHPWRSLTTRKNHVLFGDALFRYFQAVHQDPTNDDELLSCCEGLISCLSDIKNDPIAPWVKGLLLYELGLIKKKSSYFVDAVNVFSTLWKTGVQPKDRFSIALNAACCSARVGDQGHIAQAVSWIGNFFEVLEIADDMDRKVAFAWLENELESETGDLKKAPLKQIIEPWFDETKSRFEGESTTAENIGDKTQGNDEMEVEKPSTPQSYQGENRSDIQESA